MPELKFVTFRAPNSLITDVDASANEDQRSRSAQINVLISEALAAREKAKKRKEGTNE